MKCIVISKLIAKMHQFVLLEKSNKIHFGLWEVTEIARVSFAFAGKMFCISHEPMHMHRLMLYINNTHTVYNKACH